MTHAEKAKQLVDRMSGFTLDDCKSNAIVAVKEIIEALKITTGHCELRRLDEQEVQSDLDYWERIKKEIEKL